MGRKITLHLARIPIDDPEAVLQTVIKMGWNLSGREPTAQEIDEARKILMDEPKPELTAGQKAARTRKHRAAGKKAALTRKRRAAGKKAAQTRKRRAAGRKAAATRKTRKAASTE